MSCYVSHTTIDCADAYTLSHWWQELLGYDEDPDDPNLVGHVECMIFSPDRQHRILFIEVPDAKQVKNRIHFDLRPRTGSRDEEIERVIAQGATVVSDLRKADGGGWVVLADPAGNEFCILRSDAELAAARAREA
jgi:hypothetical protein